MSTSVNLGMPFLSAAQSQKEVTHNEALAILDVMVQLQVEDRHLANPPGTAVEGQSYIVSTAASSAWAGNAGNIAYLYNAAWNFITPREGYRCWLRDEDVFTVYSGSSWTDGETNVMTVYPPSTHGQYSGEKAMLTLATSVDFGQVVFCDSSGGYQKAAAGSTATVPGIGICVSSGTSGTVRGVVKRGYVCSTAWNWTKGKILFLSTAAGSLTETPSTAAGSQIQVVAVAHSSITIDVLPSLSISEA